MIQLKGAVGCIDYRVVLNLLGHVVMTGINLNVLNTIDAYESCWSGDVWSVS